MPARKQELLLRSSCFEVLIGDRELGFAEVSPPSSYTDLDVSADRPAHLYETVVLRRAMTSSTELYDWRRHIVDGRDDHRDVTIRLLSAPGGAVVHAWRLVGAWPSRWSGPSLDALANEIAWEELELTFEDLVWLDHDTRITGG